MYNGTIMKHTLCSLFIGFSALAITLALPQASEAYEYCDYYEGCYTTNSQNYYSDYSYSYYGVDSGNTVQNTYGNYYDDCYYDCYDYGYTRDYYYVEDRSPLVNLSFNYAQTTTTPTYSYPVYYQTPVPVPVYIPTPVTKTVYTPAPVKKTTTKKTKKKSDTFYVYASASF